MAWLGQSDQGGDQQGLRPSFLGSEMQRRPVAFSLSLRGGGAWSDFHTKVLTAGLGRQEGFPRQKPGTSQRMVELQQPNGCHCRQEARRGEQA